MIENKQRKKIAFDQNNNSLETSCTSCLKLDKQNDFSFVVHSNNSSLLKSINSNKLTR